MTRRLTRLWYLGLAVEEPALRSTMTTLSWDLSQPSSVTVRRASVRSSVILWGSKASSAEEPAVKPAGTRTGWIERWNWSCRATSGERQRATTGTLGRIFARARGTSPVEVMAMMSLASKLAAVSTADWASASSDASALPQVPPLPQSLGRMAPMASSMSASTMRSASWRMLCIAFNACRGYLPAAVSPESMTASVPSTTAWPTSVTSARVGRGFFCIESSICVATMTGLPASLHARTMSF
mmetsp:Transcript_17210/g.52301  ORF Transcript_17210/g.52301 Transcript_17210/m.52301 type:complete len:241 (+) Transcript_17210:247-969(+)